MNGVSDSKADVKQEALNKPGYQTTEFWLLALVVVAHIAGAGTGIVSGHEAAQNISVTGLTYTLVAFLRKWLAQNHPGALPMMARIEQTAISLAHAQLTKSGFKTTEFYIALLVAVAQGYGIHIRAIDGNVGSVTLLLTFGIYLAGRIFVKQLAAQFPAIAPMVARLGQDAQRLEPVIAAEATPATEPGK